MINRVEEENEVSSDDEQLQLALQLSLSQASSFADTVDLTVATDDTNNVGDVDDDNDPELLEAIRLSLQEQQQEPHHDISLQHALQTSSSIEEQLRITRELRRLQYEKRSQSDKTTESTEKKPQSTNTLSSSASSVTSSRPSENMVGAKSPKMGRFDGRKVFYNRLSDKEPEYCIKLTDVIPDVRNFHFLDL